MGSSLIIFDLGGVFRDSSKAINEGYRRGFSSAHIAYNFEATDIWHLRGLGKYNSSMNCAVALMALTKSKEKLRQILAKIDAEKVLDKIVEENITQEDNKVVKHIWDAYKKFFNSEDAKVLINVFPFCQEAIEQLKNRGYTLAIFTNTSKVTINRDIGSIGLDRFSMILSEDDVKNKKPSGEGIVKIMNALGYEPDQTYYVGDAVSDILAARDAGCKAIAVLSGMGTKSLLAESNPDLIFKDIKEMSDYFKQNTSKKP